MTKLQPVAKYVVAWHRSIPTEKPESVVNNANTLLGSVFDSSIRIIADVIGSGTPKTLEEVKNILTPSVTIRKKEEPRPSIVDRLSVIAKKVCDFLTTG